MQYVSGTIYNPGEPAFQGYLGWESGIVQEIEKGSPPSQPVTTGLITSLFLNGHTHIGDSALSRMIDLEMPLESIVDPPDGMKHRLLAETTDDILIEGMVNSLGNMSATGTGSFIDFREGGLHGVELLKVAGVMFENRVRQPLPDPFVFSRPPGLDYDRQEISSLLDISSGIGISAMRDWDYYELQKIASQVHARGKLLALHASETVREDIELILGLKPDILIHLTQATSPDLDRVAEENVQVVICPRSNALFGFLPDISMMLERGLSLSLGTDNLMFSTPDMFREMDFAWRLARYQGRNKGGIPSPEDMLLLSGNNMKKGLNVKSGVSLGDRAGFMVLPEQPGETGSAALSLIRGGRISLMVNGDSQWEVS